MGDIEKVIERLRKSLNSANDELLRVHRLFENDASRSAISCRYFNLGRVDALQLALLVAKDIEQELETGNE